MTTKQQTSHLHSVLEAKLAAAWLLRCGPSGDPGEWIPAEFLPVYDRDVEVAVYPTWKLHNMWSGSFAGSDGASDAWQWSIRASGLTDDEYDVLDNLGFLLDDGRGDLIVDGDHSKRPEIPDAVVEAVAVLS